MLYGIHGSAFQSTTRGSFTGRCPMTGRFMSGKDTSSDDEPLEYSFGDSHDPTDDIIARLDGMSNDDTDDDSYASCADNDRCGKPDEDEAGQCPDLINDHAADADHSDESKSNLSTDGEYEGDLLF